MAEEKIAINGVRSIAQEQRRVASASDELLIAEMWSRERTHRGYDQNAFVERISDDLQIDKREVRRVIGRQVRAAHQKMAVANLTMGQKVAEAAGATAENVIGALVDLMNNAVTVKVIMAGKEPLLDDKGEVQVLTVPNATARIRAAVHLSEILGLSAPKSVQVSGEVSHTHKVSGMSKQQLTEHIRGLMGKVSQHVAVVDVQPQPKSVEISGK